MILVVWDLYRSFIKWLAKDVIAECIADERKRVADEEAKQIEEDGGYWCGEYESIHIPYPKVDGACTSLISPVYVKTGEHEGHVARTKPIDGCETILADIDANGTVVGIEFIRDVEVIFGLYGNVLVIPVEK